MSYARQDTTTQRLQTESLRELDKLAGKHLVEINRIWLKTRRELQMSIMDAYNASAIHNKWTLSRFRSSGAKSKLQAEATSIMEQFQAVSRVAMRKALNRVYRESVMRHAWILDQVTPASRDVYIPHNLIKEAAISAVYLGAQSERMWEERWSSWSDAYRDALMHNVALNAMNEGAAADATGEVDATKANTPAYGIWDALSRIYEYEAVSAMSEGMSAVGDLNDDMVDEEVWKTRDDADVCDECDANEGMTIEEADGDIPLHPNCHCYWMLVPKSYADLLRAGDAQDRDLARSMLSRGIVPNALVVRGEDGEVQAKLIVNFERWVAGQKPGIQTK